MSVERRLPRMRRSRAAILVVGFVVLGSVCVAWAIHLDSMTPTWLVGVGIALVQFALYYRRRCPQCGQRMKYRAEPVYPTTYLYRILFDCKRCDVTWNSGEIQQEG